MSSIPTLWKIKHAENLAKCNATKKKDIRWLLEYPKPNEENQIQVWNIHEAVFS